MAIDKLIPQYLNKDDDERLIKSMEMTDALNVRVSVESEGSSSVIKNVLGNTIVVPKEETDAIPTQGYNRVIGCVSTESGDSIYYFLYNSVGFHGIYKYNYWEDNYIKLYESSHLNFARTSFIKADLIINQYGEHLLYFTDGINEPRKINATRLQLGEYDPTINTGTNEQKELFFTVAKRPPMYPPVFEFQTNTTLRANHLKENVFQFAYQYVYDDGEISALSPYSGLAVSSTNLAYNSLSKDTFSSQNNELKITIMNSDGPVKKIRVFARRNNDGAFFKIKELDNIIADNDPNSVQSFAFRNDGTYVFLSEEEINKLFDAVPRTAKTEAFSNNRLFYGNYKEGFDNIETNSFAYPVYFQRDEAPAIDVDVDISGSTDIPSVTFAWNEDLPYEYSDASILNNWDGFGVGSILNSYTAEDCAIYNNATTNGVGFNIDLSDYPEEGFQTDSTIYFRVELNASELAIGVETSSTTVNALYAVAFPVVVTTYDNNGNEVYSDTLYTGCSISYDPRTGPAPSVGWAETSIGTNLAISQGWGYRGIAKLSPIAPFVFDNNINVPAGTTRAGLCQIVSSAFIGVTSTSSVSSGDLISTVLQPSIQYSIGTIEFGEDRPSFGVSLAGSLTFSARNATIENNSSVLVVVGLDSVNLTATKALGRRYDSYLIENPLFPFTYTENQFFSSFDDVPFSGNEFTIPSQNISCDINSTCINIFGNSLSDGVFDQYTAKTIWRNFSVASSSDIFISGKSIGQSTFKAGAVHDISAIYFDHRMRACGVQRLGNEVSVAHFGDEERYSNNGVTNIDLRLIHTPPYWAKYWAPVYSKNLTYSKYLQLVVSEAMLGNEITFSDILSPTSGTRAVISSLQDSSSGAIYLSMRGLEGKNESYIDFKGSQIRYSFTEGDKLRILEYTDQNGTVVRPLHEFVVTGYKYFSDNEENPIKIANTTGNADEDTYRRTGWFLIIKDEGIPNFDRDAVSVGSDYFSQRCLIEIFNTKKNTDKKPYYEIGNVYPIIETNEGRTHGGDRSNTSIPDFDIFITSQYSFTSSQKLYIGDKITNLPNADGYGFIFGVRPLYNGVYTYSINEIPTQAFVNFNTTVSGVNVVPNGSNGLFAGVVTLKNGDAYLRVREQLINVEDSQYIVGGTTFKFNPTDPDNQEYDKFIIEDESVSDFFDSKATSIGRPHIETPDQREIIRSSSVTYSDPYAFDSAVLSLSSFNPSLFPYKDYNTKHGSITYLHDGGEVLYVLQQYKVAQQPISRQYIEHSSGGMLVTSQNVMGTENYFAGNFGPGNNPEGVVQAMGRIYFPSKTTGKVVQIGGNGIELISDKSMDAFFMENLSALDADVKIPCGFDPDNDEFIISWSEYFIEEPLIEEGGTGIDKPTDFEPVGTEPILAEPIVVVSLPNLEEMTEDRDSIQFNSNVFDEADIAFDDSGDAVVYIDRVNAEGGAYVSKDKIITGGNVRTSIKNEKGDIIGYGTISIASGQLYIPQSVADQYGIQQKTQTPPVPAIAVPPIVLGDPQVPEPEIYIPTIPADLIVVAYTGKTAAYDVSAGLWKTLYSFVPELYANVHNRMFTFYNGNIYRHNNNELRNNFYGQQYNSEIEIVSKQNPSMIKTYTALSIEGNSMWPAIISNSTQDTNIPSYKFINREGMYYSDILRNTNNTSTSNLVVLGVVASVSGQEITFANRISDATFNVGSLIVKDTGDAGGITAGQITSRNSMLVTGDVSSVVAGDILLVSSDPYISGDRIRDYYIKIRLINGIPTARELYAVNAVFETSQLHNQQVN